MSIYDLLVTPNPDDPLVSSIVSSFFKSSFPYLTCKADQYRTNPKEFEKRAAEYTAKVSVAHLQQHAG